MTVQAVVQESVLGGAAAPANVPAANAEAAKPNADPAGAKPPVVDDKGKPVEQEKPPAEVKYDFKTPDGVDLKEPLGKFAEFAKEMKLAPEDAQKYVDWYVKTAQDKATNLETAWKATNDGWVNEAKADKEIGGEGFEKTITGAKQAIQKFGNDKLIDALNMTGMGNHPEMIRFFFKVSQSFKEDNLQGGSPAAETPKDPAKILFPNHN